MVYDGNRLGFERSRSKEGSKVRRNVADEGQGTARTIAYSANCKLIKTDRRNANTNNLTLSRGNDALPLKDDIITILDIVEHSTQPSC